MGRKNGYYGPKKKSYRDPYWASLDAMLDVIYADALRQNWTYARFAEESTLSAGTVSRIGRRRTERPQFRTILLLARAVGREVSLKEGKR